MELERELPEKLLNVKLVPAWSDAKIERLRFLHAEGMTFGLIARDLHMTRNAVIGKAGRLGLAGRLTAEQRAERQRQAKTRPPRAAFDFRNRRQRAMRPMPRVVPLYGLRELPDTAAYAPATIIELKDHQCRWPCSGSGATMICCGAQRVEGLPYCESHARIAYQAPQPR